VEKTKNIASARKQKYQRLSSPMSPRLLSHTAAEPSGILPWPWF
jgi:hypothetical protein